MVKYTSQWTAQDGQQFAFEYNVKRHNEASSVRSIDGKIYHLAATNAGNGDEKPQKRPKIQKRQEVGTLTGYEIRRNNKLFHEHGDCVNQEFHEFTSELFDSHGMACRAPKTSGLSRISPYDGSMFLAEKVEVKHEFKGIDLGINFLHEYLALPDICRRLGVVVMNPWTLNDHAFHFPCNRKKMQESFRGKNESEKVDICRETTVKLRRQFSRMGFQVVHDSPGFLDKWYLDMAKYKTNSKEEVKSSWLSKEEATRLEIPMKLKEYVETGNDTALRLLLQSLFTGPFEEQNNLIMANFFGRAPANESKFTNAKKLELDSLVNEGANLDGIRALHMIAANYKKDDLFTHLIERHNMSVEAVDDLGMKPIHVAASCENPDAVRILLDKGADKTAKNQDGKTALQCLNQAERDNFLANDRKNQMIRELLL